MNRPAYFNFIEERLNLLALRVKSRGRLNILDLHGHSEHFFQFFLNEVYKWDVVNENDVKQNVEAIDLVDHTNKLILQVSATSSKQKIESSLSKDSIKTYKGYTFKFVSIVCDSDNLRKQSFINPHGITFNPAVDIIDINSILSKIRGLDINDQERIYKFVKRELVNEFDPLKLESNLATVINILSKEDWNKKEALGETVCFEIDRKISHNNLDSAKLIIEDYSLHYSRVDKIYSEFDALGSNKSNSVLSTIRQDYAQLKGNLSDDELFFAVVSKVKQKVLNSSNYTSIPVDELDQCINILVVDTFIRCKIFENPENYSYATT